MTPLADRARAVGLDPADPKYSDPHPDLAWREGDRLCSWCLRHKSRHPRLRCDVARAEFGEDSTACSWCLDAPADPDEYGRTCKKCGDRHRAEERKRPRYRRHYGTAVYRADNHGCVERVHPSELAWEARYDPTIREEQ